MNDRENKLVSVAVIVSALVHGLVVWQIMNLPIGLDGSHSLFASRAEASYERVEVFRAERDLIVEPDPAEPTDPEPAEPEPTPAKESEDIVESIDPSKLLPEVDPEPAAELARAQDPSATPPAPEGAAPRPGGAAPLKSTSRLLAMTTPDIVLPEFVASADVVVNDPPRAQALDPSAAIDIASIDALLGGAGTGDGETTGRGRVRADDSAALAAPGGAAIPGNGAAGANGGASTGDPAVARATPKLPDLPESLIQPTVDDRREPVRLDADFDYTLAITGDKEDGGLFGIGAKEAGDDYFEVMIRPRRSARRLKALHKDVVFVIDTSESIPASWIEPIKRGVGSALLTLNPGDRFNVVMFKDTVQVFQPAGWAPANEQTIDHAKQFLAEAKSSGYTDINRALDQLLVRDVPRDRVYQIILVTDGVPTRGAIDARRIINIFTRENEQTASVFCVGVGNKIDRKLLEFLAYRNKGFVIYPGSWLKTTGEIRELAGRLRYPILKDAQVDVVGIDRDRVFPRVPRDFYQGETISIYGRSEKSKRGRMSMRVTGVNGPDELDLTFALDFTDAERRDWELARQWAFWKLHDLYSEIIRQGETQELIEQIKELRQAFNLTAAY